jgi:hypothetical protein
MVSPIAIGRYCSWGDTGMHFMVKRRSVILAIWNKANVPSISQRPVRDKVTKLYNDFRELNKLAKTHENKGIT